MRLLDRLDRPIGTLRVSVIDRCNLRCSYCMPEPRYAWLPRHDLLGFEEIRGLCDVFVSLGVAKIRLTGGEPLLREDLPELVGLLRRNDRLRDLSLTTNGVRLAELAQPLAAAGLHRLTVSLDTLRPDRFRALTGRDSHARVLAGIRAAKGVGLGPLKLDTVVLRGENDDELADLVAFGREIGAEVRFIEYMDVGGATRWVPGKVMSRADMLGALTRRLGPAEPVEGRGSATAERFRLKDGTTFGIIASTTAPFCGACDRSRLTADGLWLSCLYASRGVDLRGLLRTGVPAGEIGATIAETWRKRADRGAERRLCGDGRAPLVPAEALRKNPHLEMHTRGG